MTGREQENLIASLCQALRGTFLEGRLILGGSSGLFGFRTDTPAFTEDIDFLVEESLVAARGEEIVRLLASLGYSRVPETPTFTASGRPSFDLVGYSSSDFTDRLSAPGPLRVMVFGDLGIILGDPDSVDRTAGGMPALSPAAFCAVKLMTMRVEKGSKDKLQALLVVAERASETAFRAKLSRILERFDRERRTDALADSQVAFLSLQRDPGFRDHGAEGYATFLSQAEAGYRALVEIVKGAPHG